MPNSFPLIVPSLSISGKVSCLTIGKVSVSGLINHNIIEQMLFFFIENKFLFKRARFLSQIQNAGISVERIKFGSTANPKVFVFLC
jgi:hypothetical protein